MRNLTLRQLRSVQAIARLGTVAAAARHLSLTAPAVTLQLKQVEDELGLLLFDRTSDGMRATDAGRAVIAAANAAETSLRTLADEIDAIKGVRAGVIRLGVVSTAKYYAPRLVAEFMRRQPGIDVRLSVGNRAAIEAKLKSYDLDMALMGRRPTEFAVDAMVFGDHPLVVIAPPDHPLAPMRDIARKKLAAERLLVREPGSGTRSALEAFLGESGETLAEGGLELGSNETIKQAVMAGLGIGFISAHTIALEVEIGRLVVLDVEATPIRRRWYAVCRKERLPSPAERAFKAFLSTDGPRFLPTLARLYPEEAARADREES